MKITILCFACILSTPLWGAGGLTLQQCKELALKNNAQVKNSRLDVAMAEEAKKEAFTNYFPSVSALGGGLIAEKPLFNMQTEQGAVGMMKNEMFGAVSASQPVFAGGQIVNGNRLAKVGVEVSKLQQQLSDDEVLLQTERYYWQLVAMKEKMKTVENAEAMLARIHNDVNVAFEAGIVTKNDLLRIELEQNKLAGNKLKVANGVQMVKSALGQHIGLLSDAFDVEFPVFDVVGAGRALPLPQNHAESLNHRTEYQLLEKSVDAARLQYQMEIGKNLPTVAVGVAYTSMDFDRGRQTEMKDNYAMAFATVSVPISGWWGGSHAIKKKKLAVQAAENTKRHNSELLMLQMQRLWDELNEAYQQVVLAQKSIAVAEENEWQNEDRYREGVSILSDLLDAQNLVQQSHDQYTEAVAGYYLKRTEYEQATGR
jgi:outer membrane protein TolC